MIWTMNAQHSFAWLISLTIATAVTWTLNRKFTFVKYRAASLHNEAFRYALVTIVSQTVAFLVFHGLVELAKWLPASGGPLGLRRSRRHRHLLRRTTPLHLRAFRGGESGRPRRPPLK